MQKPLPMMVKRVPTQTVLMTVSARRMDRTDATADEAKEPLSILHPQMRFVASTEDIPGGIVITTPGE
jgi:hypothetical protein